MWLKAHLKMGAACSSETLSCSQNPEDSCSECLWRWYYMINLIYFGRYETYVQIFKNSLKKLHRFERWSMMQQNRCLPTKKEDPFFETPSFAVCSLLTSLWWLQILKDAVCYVVTGSKLFLINIQARCLLCEDLRVLGWHSKVPGFDPDLCY